MLIHNQRCNQWRCLSTIRAATSWDAHPQSELYLVEMQMPTESSKLCGYSSTIGVGSWDAYPQSKLHLLEMQLELMSVVMKIHNWSNNQERCSSTIRAASNSHVIFQHRKIKHLVPQFSVVFTWYPDIYSSINIRYSLD